MLYWHKRISTDSRAPAVPAFAQHHFYELWHQIRYSFRIPDFLKFTSSRYLLSIRHTAFKTAAQSCTQRCRTPGWISAAQIAGDCHNQLWDRWMQRDQINYCSTWCLCKSTHWNGAPVAGSYTSHTAWKDLRYFKLTKCKLPVPRLCIFSYKGENIFPTFNFDMQICTC